MGALWNGLLQLLGTVLAFFYDIVPNLGISIILLTLLVNALVFPLTLKQTRSTRAMQTIQPEVERLRKEHKEEPEVLNQEIMKLYKERGVSPAGCFLPLVVQMPIWFALFRVLRDPLEYVDPLTRLGKDLMEGSPRFLTMDLARAPSEVLSTDGFGAALPYLVVVGIVIATGLLQQRLTTAGSQSNPSSPSNPQAEQMQKIGKIMPLFFGVISYVWPAGLNLYFATSNLFRTGQMWLINQIDGPPGAAQTAAPKDPTTEPDSDVTENPKPSKPQGSAKKRNRRRRK